MALYKCVLIDRLIEDTLVCLAVDKTFSRIAWIDVIMCRAWMTEIVGSSSGRLSGKTVAIKDNMHIAGVPMSCGSNFLRGFVSSCTATVVSRILDAGHMHVVFCDCVLLLTSFPGVPASMTLNDLEPQNRGFSAFCDLWLCGFVVAICRDSRMEQYSCSSSWSRHCYLVQAQTQNSLFSMCFDDVWFWLS